MCSEWQNSWPGIHSFVPIPTLGISQAKTAFLSSHYSCLVLTKFSNEIGLVLQGLDVQEDKHCELGNGALLSLQSDWLLSPWWRKSWSEMLTITVCCTSWCLHFSLSGRQMMMRHKEWYHWGWDCQNYCKTDSILESRLLSWIFLDWRKRSSSFSNPFSRWLVSGSFNCKESPCKERNINTEGRL